MRHLLGPISRPLALGTAIAVMAVAAPSTLNAQGKNLRLDAAPSACACADGTPADKDRAMGRAIAQEVLDRSLPWEGKRLNDYVGRLGKRLASASGTHETLHFQVLYSPAVAAHAFCGGSIFLNSGAITAARDEAELAAILAHEIARLNLDRCALAKPRTRRLVREAALRSENEALSPGAEFVPRSKQARVRRDEDEEADRLTVICLAKAGYDPQAAVRLFGRLEELQGLAGVTMDGGRSGHSRFADRRLRMERLAASFVTSQPAIKDTPEFEAARAEVLRYDALFAAVAKGPLPVEPRKPPKLVHRADGDR